MALSLVSSSMFLNLKTAVEREKAVQAIDVHRKCTNCVVTFWVMSQFVHFLGASRGCADFRDSTAVFRFKDGPKIGCEMSKLFSLKCLDMVTQHKFLGVRI